MAMARGGNWRTGQFTTGPSLALGSGMGLLRVSVVVHGANGGGPLVPDTAVLADDLDGFGDAQGRPVRDPAVGADEQSQLPPQAGDSAVRIRKGQGRNLSTFLRHDPVGFTEWN